MRYTIAKIGGDFAVVELQDKRRARVELIALPDGVKENDMIFVDLEVDSADVDQHE